MVHSDFHYAKAVLFSAHRLWYYIPLSLYHFQRLPFLLIKLNRMLKTSRACFWACLTLLLWSHIHSHTHLFGFSNLAICCACPALSIRVFVVIYACHLSNASNQWVIFPIRLTFAASLTLPTGEQAPLPPPFPPPQGCTVMPHCTALVALTWLFFLFMTSQDLVAFLSCTKCPETPHLAGVCMHSHWDMMLFPQCLPPTEMPRFPVRLHNRLPAPAPSIQLISPSSLPQRCLRRVLGCPLKAHVVVSCWAQQGHGVSLTEGPGCGLATGGTTRISPVWFAPRHLPLIK